MAPKTLTDVRWLALLALCILAWAVAAPKPAESIPVFANAQGGVDCGLCHSAPPNLNAYGRYIVATNFARGLDPHAQMRENLRDPISLQITGNGSNTPDPTLPKTFVNLAQVLAGGFFGKDVSYYASVPIVEGGFPAPAIDQVWGAYNGFFSGKGSLQVGKFPTPVFAPWLSQSLSLAGYALAAMPVGLNTVGVGDNRWGTSYSQIGSKGLIFNAAFMTNAGTAERAFDSDVDSGGVGQSYVGSVQFMNPSSHFTGGIAAMGGTFPLPSGAKDSFNRATALVSYSTSPKYSVNAMAIFGYDSNPTDGASLPSGSNGWQLEAIYNPFKWLHLDARYERTNDGLGMIQNNYISDVTFSILPNLIATLENVSAVGARPVMSYQLLWVGPWIRHGTPQVVAATTPGPGQTGRDLYAANCAACHGTSGAGGVGPSLRQIATRMSFEQTAGFIEKPAGIMPKLYPDKLSEEQVRKVATYIRESFR